MKVEVACLIVIALFHIIETETAVSVNCGCNEPSTSPSADGARKKTVYLSTLRNTEKDSFGKGQNIYKATNNDDDSSEEDTTHVANAPYQSGVGLNVEGTPYQEHKEEYGGQNGNNKDDNGNYHYEEHFIQYGSGSPILISSTQTPFSPQGPKKDEDKKGDGCGNGLPKFDDDDSDEDNYQYHEHTVQYGPGPVQLNPTQSTPLKPQVPKKDDGKLDHGDKNGDYPEAFHVQYQTQSFPPSTLSSSPFSTQTTVCSCTKLDPVTQKPVTETIVQTGNPDKPFTQTTVQTEKPEKPATQTTVQTGKPNKLPSFPKYLPPQPFGYPPFPYAPQFGLPPFPFQAPNPYQNIGQFPGAVTRVPVPQGFGLPIKTYQRFPPPAVVPLGFPYY